MATTPKRSSTPLLTNKTGVLTLDDILEGGTVDPGINWVLGEGKTIQKRPGSMPLTFGLSHGVAAGAVVALAGRADPSTSSASGALSNKTSFYGSTSPGLDERVQPCILWAMTNGQLMVTRLRPIATYSASAVKVALERYIQGEQASSSNPILWKTRLRGHAYTSTTSTASTDVYERTPGNDLSAVPATLRNATLNGMWALTFDSEQENYYLKLLNANIWTANWWGTNPGDTTGLTYTTTPLEPPVESVYSIETLPQQADIAERVKKSIWGYVTTTVPASIGENGARYDALNFFLPWNKQPEAAAYRSATPTITLTPFNNEIYISGENGPLCYFDGVRTGIAGACPFSSSATAELAFTSRPPTQTTKHAAGALNGTYRYIFRPKLTTPAGRVAYAPEVNVTATAVNQNLEWDTFYDADYYDLLVYFSREVVPNHRGIAFRYNRFTCTITDETTKLKIEYWDNVGATLDADGALYDAPLLKSKKMTPLMPGEVISLYDANGAFWQLPIEDVPCTTALINPSLVAYTTRPASWAGAATGTFTLGETVEIYRTTGGGSAYYFLREVPLGTIFIDSVADGSLTSNANYVPLSYTPSLQHLVSTTSCVHQQRLIVATAETAQSPSTQLIWTEPGTSTFTSDNNINIAQYIGEGAITALHSQNDILYVHTTRGIIAISGALTSAETFTVRKITSTPGAVSTNAIAVGDGSAYCLTPVGLLTVSGQTIGGEEGSGISTVLTSLDSESLQQSKCVIDGIYLYIAIQSTTSAKENFWLVYDMLYKMWFKWTGLACGALVPSFGTLFMGSGEGTGLYRLSNSLPWDPEQSGVGYDDTYTLNAASSAYPANIDMQVKTGWLTAENPSHVLTGIKAHLITTPKAGPAFTLNVSSELNWRSDILHTTSAVSFNRSSGASIGGDAYAQTGSMYGDPLENEKLVPLLKTSARSVRVTIQHDQQAAKPEIIGINVVMASKSEEPVAP